VPSADGVRTKNAALPDGPLKETTYRYSACLYLHPVNLNEASAPVRAMLLAAVVAVNRDQLAGALFMRLRNNRKILHYYATSFLKSAMGAGFHIDFRGKRRQNLMASVTATAGYAELPRNILLRILCRNSKP